MCTMFTVHRPRVREVFPDGFFSHNFQNQNGYEPRSLLAVTQRCIAIFTYILNIVMVNCTYLRGLNVRICHSIDAIVHTDRSTRVARQIYEGGEEGGVGKTEYTNVCQKNARSHADRVYRKHNIVSLSIRRDGKARRRYIICSWSGDRESC